MTQVRPIMTPPPNSMSFDQVNEERIFFFLAGYKLRSELPQSFVTTEENDTKTEEMSKRKGRGKKRGLVLTLKHRTKLL